MSDFRFLSLEELEKLHDVTIERHGGSHGVLNRGALESALAAPVNDAHYAGADVFAVGGAYLFHVASAHGFVDGNKRAALVACGAFLMANGVNRWPAEPDLEATTRARRSHLGNGMAAPSHRAGR